MGKRIVSRLIYLIKFECYLKEDITLELRYSNVDFFIKSNVISFIPKTAELINWACEETATNDLHNIILQLNNNSKSLNVKVHDQYQKKIRIVEFSRENSTVVRILSKLDKDGRHEKLLHNTKLSSMGYTYREHVLQLM